MLLFLTVIQFCSWGKPITFLGIPVDGSKSQMIKALKHKKFHYDSRCDLLEGEFNGQKVFIKVQAYNNKVYRVGVIDYTPANETVVKKQFNNLYYQFSRNDKYQLFRGEEISDEEDIKRGLSVDKKEYAVILFPSDKSINGLVYYKIVEHNEREYKIVLLYDNPDNMPSGDDL